MGPESLHCSHAPRCYLLHGCCWTVDWTSRTCFPVIVLRLACSSGYSPKTWFWSWVPLASCISMDKLILSGLNSFTCACFPNNFFSPARVRQTKLSGLRGESSRINEYLEWSGTAPRQQGLFSAFTLPEGPNLSPITIWGGAITVFLTSYSFSQPWISLMERIKRRCWGQRSTKLCVREGL